MTGAPRRVQAPAPAIDSMVRYLRREMSLPGKSRVSFLCLLKYGGGFTARLSDSQEGAREWAGR